MHTRILTSVLRRPERARLITIGTVVALLASLAIAPAARAASITVTTGIDENGPGGSAACSLREAITAANRNVAFGGCQAGTVGADSISLGARTHFLGGAAGEDANAGGDLDVNEELTITGLGAARTIVDGSGIDRVIHVQRSATLRLNSVTIQNGSAPEGREGGGILVRGGSLELVGSVVGGNRAAYGGGVYADHDFYSGPEIGATVVIVRTTIFGNTAARASSYDYCGGEGGGIYFGPGTAASIEDSTIAGNRAVSGDGGGLVVGDYKVSVVISRTTIAGNYASDGQQPEHTSRCGGNGDGLFAWSPVKLTDVTISANGNESRFGLSFDGRGGGVYALNGLDLLNVTLVANGAAEGGNVYRYPFGTGAFNAANTIAGDPAAGGNCAGTLPASSYSLEPDGVPGPCGFIKGDPQLGPLASNGGLTQTHAIGTDSAARNAGANCAATDQRGVPRPQEAACDIGAYELTYCQGGIVNVVGTAGDDRLIGTSTNEVMLGMGGNDLLAGGGGDDRLCAGAGNDTLRPGTGNDRVSGDSGIDTLDFTGSTAGVSVNLATGAARGQGSDAISGVEHVTGTGYRDILRGNGGINRLRGVGGNDDLLGTGGNDTLEGGAGNDLLRPGTGNDRVVGYTGIDTLDFTGATGGVSVNLATGAASGQGSDTLSSVENVTGTGLRDILRGNGGVNRLRGQGGNDDIYGASGSDALEGGSGNDVLRGDAGNDSLNGGTGTDTCLQGTGTGTNTSCER